MGQVSMGRGGADWNPGRGEPGAPGGLGGPGGGEGLRRTALFTKRPVAGQVKTRLSPPLEPREAARLAEAMLRDVARRLAPLGSALRFAPAEAAPWFRRELPALVDQAPQRGRDLGERLANHFDEALDAPPVTAVVVGSDQPWMDAARVEAAHRRLAAGADLVLGPDLGGGYDLVGLSRAEPRLFREVEMSTAGMCAATLAVAERLGLRAEVLEPVYDVDLAADLERLVLDLARSAPDAPSFPVHTARLLVEWGRLAPFDESLR